MQSCDQHTGSDAAIDIDALDLIKRVLMPGIEIFVTKTTINHDRRDRFAAIEIGCVFFESTVLHRAGMSRCDERLAISIPFNRHKCVIVITSWMAFGKIERFKHMVLVVDLARILTRKAHTIKDVGDRVHLACQRMNRAVLTRQQRWYWRVEIHRRSDINRAKSRFWMLDVGLLDTLFEFFFELID